MLGSLQSTDPLVIKLYDTDVYLKWTKLGATEGKLTHWMSFWAALAV